MKQTSVEWLQAEFNKWADGKVFIPQDLLEEAKRLEKEQIIAAGNFLPHDEQNEIKTPEEYYNQTYNN